MVTIISQSVFNPDKTLSVFLSLYLSIKIQTQVPFDEDYYSNTVISRVLIPTDIYFLGIKLMKVIKVNCNTW